MTDEAGQGVGKGFNLNIPLPNGAGDDGYEHAMAELVVPALSEFKPEMIVVTFGQDSSQVSVVHPWKNLLLTFVWIEQFTASGKL